MNSKGWASGFRLSGMAKQIYTPTIGELVVSQDHEGIYRVRKVSDSGMVDLERHTANTQEPIVGFMQVPRSLLKPFNEDANQATATKD